MLPDRIAVISDTHDTVPAQLLDRLSEATEIWHLGDVVSPHILFPIEALGKPLLVVRGNCDYHTGWPLKRTIERHGVHFQLQHLPPRESLGNVDAILYGHLHRPQQEDFHGTRFLNPGAITQPRGGSSRSFAWITFLGPRNWTWQVEPF